MIRRSAVSISLSLVFLLLIAACTTTQEVGLIGSENVTGSSGTEALTVFSPQGPSLGTQLNVADRYALAVDRYNNRAYASDRQGTIHIIDALEDEPNLSGTLSLSHSAHAIAMRHPLLIVAIGTRQTGTGFEGVLSTSSQTNSDVDEASLGSDVPYTVDVCDDNETILVGLSTSVQKFTVDDSGTLTDTGETFDAQNPVGSVYCAPGSETAIVVASVTANMRSFDIASMSQVDVRELGARASTSHPTFPPIGLAGAFGPDGERFYVRSERGDFTGEGFVEAFSFTPSTGALGSSPAEASIQAVGSWPQRSVQSLAVSLDGEQLYVTEPREDRVLVFDASSLTQEASLTGSGFERPLTIVIGGE